MTDRQQPGPLPKFVTPETVTRSFRKLRVLSLPASFAFRLCSVPSGQSRLARPFRARVSSSTFPGRERGSDLQRLGSWAVAMGTGMAQLEGYYFSAALSCTFLVSCLLFSAFSRALREPYMDEIFHLPQAQRYCEGHFSLSQVGSPPCSRPRTGRGGQHQRWSASPTLILSSLFATLSASNLKGTGYSCVPVSEICEIFV